MTDEEKLIKKAKGGDLQSFDTLLKNYQGFLKGLSSRYSLNHVDSDEIVQLARIKIFKNIKKFKGGNFQGWIGTILHNSTLDFLSHKKSELKYIHTIDEEYWNNIKSNDALPSLSLENKDFADNVSLLFNKAYKKLSSKHRKIVKACLVDNLTYTQASKRLKIKRGTIMSGLYYAKTYLKRRMEPFLNKI